MTEALDTVTVVDGDRIYIKSDAALYVAGRLPFPWPLLRCLAIVPRAWRDRLRELTDRAIGFARDVAAHTDSEAEARRATSLLYHVASAVALAWEGGRIHEMRGDARRLLLSRMVIDHRVSASDPFRLTENAAQRAITSHLLGDRAVAMAEVGELLVAA